MSHLRVTEVRVSLDLAACGGAPPLAQAAAKTQGRTEGLLQTAKRFVARWTGGETPEPETRTLRTRASDHMPRLDFEATDQEPGKSPVKPTELVRETGKTFD